ncbi:MAG: hypothetical protein ACRD18_00135 [Terriglobia bacterium]
MLLLRKVTCEVSGLLLILLAACLAMTAPQSAAPPQVQVRSAARQGVISQRSLGEIAREAAAARNQKDLKGVPLYTNDNLPKGSEGLSILGPGVSPGGAAESNARVAGQNPAAGKEIPYLRRKLSQAQEHLQLHQRELAVLQQQINQSKMQWYPNPSQTLMQEYSRQSVANLANKINEKRQQIVQDQQEVSDLNDQLQRAQARFGLVNAAAQAATSGSRTALPPGVKPGTPEYWQARIQAAREQLAMVKEEQGVAKNELSLLKLQQLRSLDPNVQASLASSTSAKQEELSAAAQAVEKAQQEIEKLERDAQKAESGRQ